MSFRGLKRRLGFSVSPSPERDPTGRIVRTRAVSPTDEELQRQYAERGEEIAIIRAQEAVILQRLQQREASISAHKQKVNEIINSINGYLTSFFGEGEVNVDEEDPNIRFLIGMIVTSNNARISAVQKLARSKLLLQAVANVIINIAKRTGRELSVWLPIIITGLSKVGMFLVQLGVASGRAAFNVASLTASAAANSIRSFAYKRPRQEVQGVALSPPREMQQSMHDMASAAYESVAAGLPAFYDALTRVLGRVYELLAPCVATGASMAASLASSSFNAVCRYFTPHQVVEQAVSEVVNRSTPPQQEEEESICAICMEGEQDNPEPLGYVIRHHAVRSWHPNRFHRSCLQGCQNKCPICRAAGPVWGEQLPQRQDGGGSKKYKSKTRTKSKSKSRRYLSKPHKSRKARKRVRHASSRRK
jgi:hypothetical protein